MDTLGCPQEYPRRYQRPSVRLPPLKTETQEVVPQEVTPQELTLHEVSPQEVSLQEVLALPCLLCAANRPPIAPVAERPGYPQHCQA